MADNEEVPQNVWVPPKDGEDFNRFKGRDDRSADKTFEPVRFSTWNNPPKVNPYYASFGDQGVTASVNSYGDLMQFGRYLGHGIGTSGMFSADHKETPEPLLVQSRAKALQEMCDDQGLRKMRDDEDTTYGLVFKPEEKQLGGRRSLKYVRDRWPRFEFEKFEKNPIKVTIQWMVHEDIVLQQYVVSNVGDKEKNVSFSFGEGMLIRDLEYLDFRNHFNDSERDDETFYKTFKGLDNYSWVRFHKLPKAEKEDVTEEPEGNPPEANEKPMTEYDTDGINSSIKTPNVEPSAVAVVAAVFFDGKAMQWNDAPWAQKLQGQTTLEVVTAYKMILLPESKVDWKTFLIPAESANVNRFLQQEEENIPFSTFNISGIDKATSETSDANGSQSLAQDNPLGPPDKSSAMEYLLHRHLEHVLSVCAIPLREGLLVTGKPDKVKQEQSSRKSEAIMPVALTCGDISMHRVCTSASFFAFRFLVDVKKRLDHAEPNNYVKSLRERIDVVCRGHLAWLLNKVEKPNGYFSANYWVTGATMPSEGSSWMPGNALTDTAFQLIKVAEFASLYPDDGMKKAALDRIQIPSKIPAIFESWVKDLQNRDKRGYFAWSKHRTDDVNVFRLDYHIWIWKALKSVEDLGLSKQASSGDDPLPLPPITSSGVQKETLNHFTTLNDVSGKRMLAVTRSSRETRFLLHARDTVVFYGIDWGLPLEDTSYSDVWKDTLETQIHHNENQETGWNKTLRYALAMAMGSRGNSINKKSPADLVQSSLKVLFESTSASGFFPGLLNENTKEPQLFGEENERDSYFHASFEIPLVFLRRAAAIKKICEETPGKLANTQQEGIRHDLSEINDMLTTQPKHQDRASATPDITAVLLEIGKLLDAKTSKASRKAAEMKKSIPFNTLINQTNIVEVVGEWLYNYPSFLQSDAGMKLEDAEKQIEDLSKATRDVTKDKIVTTAAVEFTRARNAQLKATDALDKAAKAQEKARKAVDELIAAGNAPYDARNRLDRALSKASDAYGVAHAQVEKFDFRDINSHFSTRDKIQVTIVDTPKSKSNPQGGYQNKKDRREREIDDYHSSHELWEKLSQPRKGEDAKKRLIWIRKASDEAALVCYLTSPEEEKQSMLDFYNRHANFDKWFYDDTNMARNTWTSELHLSFYQLLTIDTTEPTTKKLQPRELSFPGTLKTPFARASMGFRFYGDFFDRYWTCHFIESAPATASDFEEWLGNSGDQISPEERSKSQRKVLELRLLARILTEILNSTLDIFEEVKAGLGISGNLDPGFLFLSMPSSDEYFYSSHQWEIFQHLLRIVEADLSTALEKVSKWEMREKDRGQERPRWTHKDETKYGRTINKLSIRISGKIGELKNCCTSIKSLKETVDATQDKKREDLSLRGSENIRIFTYVTVVFLPLGFAASIFSVEHRAVGHLVICAVIALVITFVALFNAATVNRAYERAAKKADKYYTYHMDGSYLKQLREKQRKLANSSSASAEASSPLKASTEEKQREPPIIAGPWHSWFWLGYVFVELPARRVLQALYAMKHLKVEEDKDAKEQDAKKSGSHKPIWPVVLCVGKGALFLPLFLLSWLVQLFIYNVSDFLRVVWTRLVRISSSPLPDPPDAETDEQHMQKMAYPLEPYRPLLRNTGKAQPAVVIEGEGSENDSNEGDKYDSNDMDKGKKLSVENSKSVWRSIFSIFSIRADGAGNAGEGV